MSYRGIVRLMVPAETGFAATLYECSLDGTIEPLNAFPVPPVSH